MLYPGAIGMSVFVLSEAIFCPIVLLVLLSTTRAIESHPDRVRFWSWLFLGGMLSGAACLARPSWSLWPIVFFPYLLFATKPAIGLSIKIQMESWISGCFVFCLGICLIMAPWWIRNYQITGKFVPTTLQVGASLYDGWHPGATGSSDEGMEFVNDFMDQQRAEDEVLTAQGRPLDGTLEWRLDQRQKNAAIRWAIENSSDAVKLGLVKFVKTWSPFPVARELGGDAIRWMEAIGYCAIMFFAAIGIVRCYCHSGAWLYAMPCIYFGLLHMFFIGSVRYRQPAVLILCVLGGVGCMSVAKWICNPIQLRRTKQSPMDR